MVIYIVLVIFLLLLSQYRYAGIAFSFVVLFIVSALRADSVGRDHLTFKLAFLYEISDYRIADLLKKYEIGWMAVNLFVKDYFNDFQVVVAIAAMLTLYPIYLTMKKMSLHMGFAVLLYFLLFYYCLSFSLIRQFIAISFFVLAVYYFEKNNMVKFIITIICAAMFHYSAFAMILMLLVLRPFSFSYKFVMTCLILSFLIGFSGITDKLRYLIELLPFEKYAHYVDYNADESINRFNVYLFLVPKNIMCLLLYKYMPRKSNPMFMKIFFIGMLLSNLFISISLVSRIVLYFTIFEVFLLPNMVYLQENQRLRMTLRLIVLGYGLVYFAYYVATNRGEVIPYAIFQ